uniref:NADH-ubiquinone oxidoreductase chain 6 n=1 Tax=Nigidionus parryi TaxID=618206 RepID=A0A3G1CBX1_9SCAR|nr:NADH dehydrogenase subunit 6 [Nigidionus parryi]
MMILMMSSIMISFVMVFVSHPLSMGLSLLFQSTLIALLSGMLNLSYWYSYILFLIMVGGMLVLFMYMTNTASNEKFIFSKPITIMVTLFVMSMLSFLMFSDSWKFIFPVFLHKMSIFDWNTLPSLNKFLNQPFISVSSLIIIYLLLTLVAIIKISNIKHGPLRHLN